MSTDPVRLIEAEITLRPTALGGRHGPIISGYRPGFRLRGVDTKYQFDAAIHLEAVNILGPGESTLARLAPFRPEFWTDVKPGDILHFYEGLREIGTATVIAIS